MFNIFNISLIMVITYEYAVGTVGKLRLYWIADDLGYTGICNIRDFKSRSTYPASTRPTYNMVTDGIIRVVWNFGSDTFCTTEQTSCVTLISVQHGISEVNSPAQRRRRPYDLKSYKQNQHEKVHQSGLAQGHLRQ